MNTRDRRIPASATTRLLDNMSMDEWQTATPPPPSALEEACRTCLEKMRRMDRDLLLAYYYERLTYREIAERWGWANKGSAHWRVKRALAELRRRIIRTIGEAP